MGETGQDAAPACIFCQIVAGKLPAKLLHDDADVVAFRDLSPRAPEHVLVIPRRHVETLADAPGGAEGEALLGKLMLAAQSVAASLGLGRDGGYRVVINCGENAGQSVFHLHVHVLGGRSFGWPPG